MPDSHQKNKVIILICLGMVLSVLFFRSAVYQIVDPEQPRTETQTNTGSDQDRILMHFHERHPYYVQRDGTVHGLVADPINNVFEQADIPITWVKTPAKRQLDIIRNNKDMSCAAGWFKTPAREEFARYSLPVYQDRPFVAIALKSNPLIEENETLERVFRESRLRLLVKDGYSYGTYVDEMMMNLKPWEEVTTGDNTAMLKMLVEQRADYCFMAEEEANDMLLFSDFNKANFKIVRFGDMPLGNKRYVICSKKVPEFKMAQLNNVIEHILLKSSH